MAGRTTWRHLVAVGATLVVLTGVLPGAERGFFSLGVATLAVVSVGATTCRRLEDPTPWRWFVLAGALFISGNAVEMALSMGDHRGPPFPSPADPAFLIGYAALATGVAVLVHRRSAGTEGDNVIDALMVTTVVAVVVWAWVLAPAIASAGLTDVQRALEVVYALFDLALIGGAIRLAVGSGIRIPSYYFLAAALGCVLVADTVISLQTAGSARGLPVPVVLSLTFVLFALAGLHPSVDQLTESPAPRETELTRQRMTLLGVVVLVIPVCFVVGHALGEELELPALVVGSVLLGLLAVVRMAGLVRAKERRAARQQVLGEAGKALTAATSREQLYYVALVSLAALVEISGRDVCVGIAENREGTLVPVGAFGPGVSGLASTSVAIEELPQGARDALRSGRWYSGVRSGGLCFFPGMAGDPLALGKLLLVPLRAKENTVALFAAVSPSGFGPELRESAELLAGQVALALEGAALTEELHRRRSERRFRALVEQSSELVVVVDLDGRVSFVSPASRLLLGIGEEEMLGQSPLLRVHPDDQPRAASMLDRAWTSTGVTDSTEVRLRLAGETYGWFELRAQNLTTEEEIEGTVIHAREVTDRKLAQVRLSESEARFRSLVQHASDVVMVLDDALGFRYLSPSVSRLLGYRSEDLSGLSLAKLCHVSDVRHCARMVSTELPTERTSSVELRMRHATGRWMSLEVTITDLRHDPAVRGIVLNGRDIAERKKLELELRHQALHDALTGLANRTLFIDRIAQSLDHRGDGAKVGIIFIDLDDFKAVNDGLGHTTGDALLIETAERLRRCVRSADMAARLGGDEFAVIVDDTSRDGATERVARRILAVLSQPVTLGVHELYPAASLGVAVSGASGGTHSAADELLRDADIAMYAAKVGGKGRVEIFHPEMRAHASANLALASDLAAAVERDELYVRYQPIVELSSRRVVGAEALARWYHPVVGPIPPAVFIPIAEKSGVIHQLGETVIDKACATLRRCASGGTGRPFRMSVNLSVRQLDHPGLPEQVANAIGRHGIRPADLMLEITESISPVNLDVTNDRLVELKQLGVRLAIDDFGVGYSSLASLERLPVDELKIDRSFISSLEDGGDSDMVRAIINLGDSRRLSTVAEGVETGPGARMLSDLGCDLAQGFYFSVPVGPNDLEGVSERVVDGGRVDRVGS